MSTLIELVNVHKHYYLKGGVVHALRGVSLRIDEGDFISIMGPSGSGKTTLLNIIGFLDVPTAGEVYFRGRLVKGLSDSELSKLRGREVGFVFQTFNLIPRLSVLQNVILPMTYVGKIPRAEWRARAIELLELVGLRDKANRRPTELSGGEMQRVAIARALANDPSVVLADEPTGNLDSRTGDQIMELFKSLNELGRTVVVVTHNVKVASYAHRNYSIVDGMLVG